MPSATTPGVVARSEPAGSEKSTLRVSQQAVHRWDTEFVGGLMKTCFFNPFLSLPINPFFICFWTAL